MHLSIITNTDSYKFSHWLQYPKGTEGMFSYIEARNQDAPNNFAVFFGLQPILEMLARGIQESDILIAEQIAKAHGVPFNLEGWKYILDKHDGMIPVRIKAVPEGSVVPNGNVLVTVESTDPNVAWIASYIEAAILRVWYTTTVATKSYRCKQVIKEWMERTCDNLDGLQFKLHDFGARGVSSSESSAMGGMAHLVNFAGTDTVFALAMAFLTYNDKYPLTSGQVDKVDGFSIPAAEHSTITSWGRENEVEAYRNMLKQYGGEGKILAVVSDSYDIDHACEKLWGEELRQEVIDSGATVVIRPDSGDPLLVIPRLLKILDSKFGSVKNTKGYKVLNNVRLIQGDGIDTPETIDRILFTVANNGYSADNIAFGMGGGLLQHCNRDTLGFAMKCSAIKVDGEWRDVFKDPKTQSSKKSKRGRLTLVHDSDGYRTMTEQEAHTLGWSDKRIEALETVFENGLVLRHQSMTDVRKQTGLWQL